MHEASVARTGEPDPGVSRLHWLRGGRPLLSRHPTPSLGVQHESRCPPPVWRVPLLGQERRDLAVLVEDKLPQPNGPTCPTGRSRQATVTAVASGLAVAYSDRSPCPSHRGSRRGLHQARRGGPQECGARGAGVASAIWWPPGTANTRCRYVVAAGPGPLLRPRRSPHGYGGAGCTEATYGHGRSSAVAFDGYARQTGDTPPQPKARTPTPTRGVRPRPSPRWMNRPGRRPGDSEAGGGRACTTPNPPRRGPLVVGPPAPIAHTKGGQGLATCAGGPVIKGCRRDVERTPADVRVWLPVFEIPVPMGGRQLGPSPRPRS